MTGSQRTLEVDAVIDAARSCSGGDLVVSDDYCERLAKLLHHLDAELGLDERSKATAFDVAVDLVVSRSEALRDRQRYPEIADEVIDRPFIVAGMGRSGTTLMHALLAADPCNRAAMHWEVVRPSPPPGLSAADDSRIGRTNAEVTGFLQRVPRMLVAHPYFDLGSCGPIECGAFGGLDLRNTYGLLWWKVPAMLQVNLGGDDVALYEFQRMVLQNLQFRRPVKRWALKGLHHHARLTALKTVFPDSTVVWIHRDPLKVIPSMFALLYDVYSSLSAEPVDPRELGELLLYLATSYIEAGLRSPYVDDPGVCHIRYADFSKDHVGVVASIYERRGLTLDRSGQEAMTAWLHDPANSGNRYGKAEYSLEPFGITPERVDELLGEYRTKFDIPYE